MRLFSHLSIPLCVAIAALGTQGACASSTTAVEPPSTRVGDGVSPRGPGSPAPRYPQTRAADDVEHLHGVAVADPYRWLEAMKSDETRAWMRAQDSLSRTWLETSAEPSSARAQHAAIGKRIETIAEFSRIGVPIERGGSWFWTERRPDQQRPVLMSSRGQGSQSRPQVVLDVNNAADDLMLAGWAPSEDGRLLAYGTRRGGLSWAEWRIRDLARGRDLDEVLRGLNRSPVVWAHDGRGLYYGRFEVPAPGQELNQVLSGMKVYYHRVGTDQSQDVLVYARPDHPEWFFKPLAITEDGRYLVITARAGAAPQNRVFYRDLSVPDSPVEALFDTGNGKYVFRGSQGHEFWFETDVGAPRGRFIGVDIRRPEPENWTELIAQDKDTLNYVSAVAGRFVANYVHDAVPVYKVFNRRGQFERVLDMPYLGMVWSGFSGRFADRQALFRLNSINTPGTTFRLDPKTGATSVFRQPKLAFDPGDYVIRQIHYPGQDGTRVPMILAHRRDLDRTRPNPVFMYGYGAFGWSAFPWFQPHWLWWMETGGVFALPGIRGGGEYGEAWHRAGMKHQKQTSIDDFIAASEWLIREGHTSPDRLAINGGSASGMLVGAAMIQRPELYAAVVIDYPVIEMLRFHKFTAGARWLEEFGNPDDPGDFKVLHAYSPYHNLRPGTCYPATFITAGENDDVAAPAQAYKFAAAAQSAQSCDRPILLRVAWGAGHSLGATPAESRATMAAQMAFLHRVLTRRTEI